MATDHQNLRFKCCFHTWLSQLRLDLDEMHQTLDHVSPSTVDDDDQTLLNLLVKKNINHYQEYMDSRALLAQHDAFSFLSPTWGSTFSNSFLWIGGCRASLVIRHVYALVGLELEDRLPSGGSQETRSGSEPEEQRVGEIRNGNLGDLSANQLKLIDDLHRKTVKAEDHLSSHLASLQEDIADVPLVVTAKNCKEIGEASEGVDQALEAHATKLAGVLTTADNLRLSTLKDLAHILTPFQCVELLAAGKKLHLSMYEWGKRRDRQLGN